MKNGRIMGLKEWELKASTSPLRIDDTQFPLAAAAGEFIWKCVLFFIYC